MRTATDNYNDQQVLLRCVYDLLQLIMRTGFVVQFATVRVESQVDDLVSSLCKLSSLVVR